MSRTIDYEPVLLEGWCCKRSAHLHVFRYRWIALTPTRLLPYRSKRGYESGARPTDPIAVSEVQFVRALAESTEDTESSGGLVLTVRKKKHRAAERHVLLAFMGAPSAETLPSLLSRYAALCCFVGRATTHDMRFLRDAWASCIVNARMRLATGRDAYQGGASSAVHSFEPFQLVQFAERYCLERGNPIGEGAFATVHRGRCVQSGSVVAVKRVSRWRLAPQVLERLQAEVDILRRVRGHPHVVELLNHFESRAYTHIVMELLPGGDIFDCVVRRFGRTGGRYGVHGYGGGDDDYRDGGGGGGGSGGSGGSGGGGDSWSGGSGSGVGLTRGASGGSGGTLSSLGSGGGGGGGAGGDGRGGYSEDDVRSMMQQALDALRHLQSCRVVHRDVKPENVLLTDSAATTLKLADFGMAVELSGEEGADTNRCTGKQGTPGYLAPEILRGDAYAYEVDVWSMGCLLFVLLSGTMAFDVDDDASVRGGCPPFLHPNWSVVSDEAKAVVRAMLAPEPHKRATADELLRMRWLTRATRRQATLQASLECIAERAFDAPTRARCNSHAGDYGPPLPSLLPLDALKVSADASDADDDGGAAPPPPLLKKASSLTGITPGYRASTRLSLERGAWGSSGSLDSGEAAAAEEDEPMGMLLPTRSRSASRPGVGGGGVPRTRTRTSSSVGSVPEDVELWMEEANVHELLPRATEQDELCSGEWAARSISLRRSERASSADSFSGVL